MDPIVARREIDRARAKWVLDPNVTGEIGAALQHLRRRSPIRPFALHADSLGARPGEALPTDAHAIPDRLSISQDIVEAALTGRDDHCARTVSLTPWHYLARGG